MLNFNKFVSILFFSTSFSAFAVYDPSWDRPVFSADMRITESTQIFNDAANVILTLTQRDGDKEPSGLLLRYDVVSKEETFEYQRVLKVGNISNDDCGAIHYVANLPNQDDPANGLRVTVHLIDYSSSKCESQNSPWVAEVREGYGWCGTFDARMELEGTPEPVLTIESLLAQ